MVKGQIKLRRILIALAIGLTPILLVYYFLFYHPIGSGPAGPTVGHAPFEKPWSERPVVLFGLGDSVTKGYGASPGHSYFELLAANPPDEFDDMKGICLKTVLPSLSVRNWAVSGSTSIECLEDQVSCLKPYGNDVFGVVVISTGGNDIIHMYGRIPPREGAMYGATFEEAKPWIDHYETRLDTIVEEVGKAFAGGCHIFMANIYDPSDGFGHPEAAFLPKWPDMLKILDAYNGIIARCAEKHDNVTLVDMHGLFLGHGIQSTWFWGAHYDSADPHYWYFNNIEDPNNRGYDALRRLFLNRMAETLPGLLK